MSRPVLISPRRFAETEFEPGSAPCDRTVRRWVEQNFVPGVHIGGRTYIDLTAFRASHTSLFEKVMRDVRAP